MPASDTLIFAVNGIVHEIHRPDPTTLLVDWLRSAAENLTGTKYACGEGGCGACAVTLTTWDPDTDTLTSRPINACLRPICLLDGQAITTVEGIGNSRDGLDPVQARIVACNGSQCGFCTPGFVMNMWTGLVQSGQLTERQIEDRFDGHICRCTGFRPILDAMRSFASDAPEKDGFRSNHPCQPASGDRPPVKPAITPVCFPEALKARVRERPALAFSSRGYHWHRPRDLAGVQRILRGNNGDRARVKLVGGNTDVGIYKVDVNDPHVLVDTSQVRAMHGIEREQRWLRIGAHATLQELLDWLEANQDQLPRGRARGLVDLRRHLQIVANLEVRSAGTVGGNLMMTRLRASTSAPFPSDLMLTFAELDGTAVFASRTWRRRRAFPVAEIPGPESLPDDAVLVEIRLPWTHPLDVVRSYKVRRRNEDSAPIVNAAFRVRIDRRTRVAGEARLYLGGLRGLPVRAVRTEDVLRGQVWDEALLDAALVTLAAEVAEAIEEFDGTAFDPPGYRRELCLTLFYKFFVHACEARKIPVSAEVAAAGRLVERPLARGVEITDVYPQESPVGMPILKEQAWLQATGEAKYPQDLNPPVHGLWSCYVLTTKGSGTVTWVASKEAALERLQAMVPGVVDVVDASDVPGVQVIGQNPAAVAGAPRDAGNGTGGDPIFVTDGKILSWGQPVALVLARDPWSAQTGARLAQQCLDYHGGPGIQTIDEAIAADSFWPDQGWMTHIPEITRAGSDTGWLADPTRPLDPGGRVVKGTQRSEAQAQFYMEVQNCMSIPEEGGTVQVWSSTQHPAAVQQAVASALGIDNSRVTVTVRRLGGGFGGKQFRPYMLAAATAVAAWKRRVPVKLVLTRNQDMETIGKRHPYRTDYAATFTDDGRIQGMKVDFISNGGCSYDASFYVMDLAQQNGDAAYLVPTYQTTGRVARTTRASNSAMRSFGTIQCTLGVEEAIERVAHELGMKPEDVRRANLYPDATATTWPATHFGQAMKQCRAAWIFDHLREHCHFDERWQAIQAFNATSRWSKRGISLMPFKYGVGYQPRSMEQGQAYLSIFQADGTVLVQHGGIEVGQGIDTKMAQLAAQTLGIPMSLVRIADTTTNTASNAQATAASSGSDLFGSAVQMAAATLRDRLADYVAAAGMPGWATTGPDGGPNTANWLAVVQGAYNARMDLQAEATYKEPYIDNIGGNHQYGRAFLYFTYSAACSEVEIDVLTGETTILRTDILFDNGQSLNPCLDIGQIEGGFVQGVGLMLTEQMAYNPDGSLYSNGTWTYKPPGTKTIPIAFNVRLHQVDRVHPVTGLPLDYASVNGSKGIGEPPLVLAATVFFAVKHAIAAARRDGGDERWPDITAPATVGRIQSACQVDPDRLRL